MTIMQKPMIKNKKNVPRQSVRTATSEKQTDKQRKLNYEKQCFGPHALRHKTDEIKCIVKGNIDFYTGKLTSRRNKERKTYERKASPMAEILIFSMFFIGFVQKNKPNTDPEMTGNKTPTWYKKKQNDHEPPACGRKQINDEGRLGARD